MVSAAALASHARRDVQVKVGRKDMLRTVSSRLFDGHAVGYAFSYVGLLSAPRAGLRPACPPKGIKQSGGATLA